MTVRISVIIPCYNQGQYLAQAVDSALAQDCPGVEVIVVNDGSQDDTAAVAHGYGERIVYVEQVNRGLSGARNAGVRVARGVYLAFLDSDDAYLPGALARLSGQLDADPTLGLICGEALLWDGVHTLGLKSQRTGRPRHPTDFRWETVDFTPTPSTIMLPRPILLQVGLFDEGLKRAAEDWLLSVRVARHYAMRYLTEPLIDYRVHSASATSDPEMIHASNRYAARAVVESPEFAGYPAFFRARLHYYRAAAAWRFEPKTVVLRHVWAALRADPRQLGYGWAVLNKGLRRALARRQVRPKTPVSAP